MHHGHASYHRKQKLSVIIVFLALCGKSRRDVYDGRRCVHPIQNLFHGGAVLLSTINNPNFFQEFDTVLAATGRTADTKGLGLERLGVALSKSGKVLP